MSLSRPDTSRLPPVTDPDDRQRELMRTDLQRDDRPLAIFATLAHNLCRSESHRGRSERYG